MALATTWNREALIAAAPALADALRELLDAHSLTATYEENATPGVRRIKAKERARTALKLAEGE